MKPGETLKNCPFCGDVGNLRADVGGPGRDQFWVECENPDCAGMGPIKFSMRAAQRGWNRRENPMADTLTPERIGRIVGAARAQGLL